MVATLIALGSFTSELNAQTGDSAAIQTLRDRIAALSPTVRADDAQRVAQRAYATAEQLRRDYKVIGPPLFHNFLVNTGVRKRGLCFQWAEDLLVQLDALKLSSLELHWGEARAGTWREHNCVVVTARSQPFAQGIILDCWRHSGHLFWSKLAADHYPWIENRGYGQIARAKGMVARGTPAPANSKIKVTTAVEGSAELAHRGGSRPKI